jgi:uncharacterized membrane protein YcaP (DUF421 family)
VFLLLLFRLDGKRSLAQITTFDIVLLLIIAEAIQQGLLGDDFSVTNAFLVITTLFAIDVGMSLGKRRSKMLDKITEGVPMVLVEDGRPLRDRMGKLRVDKEDILTTARERQGLERMDQIRYAVLERSGGISIIPKHPIS